MTGRHMMEMLRRSGGLEALSKQLGVSPAVAAAGSEALLPAIVGGLRNRAETAGGGDAGLDNLVDMLGSLGGGRLAANVLGPEPTDVAKGNSVLAELFGSKDVSRSVAAHAAKASGIDAETLERMLPILAMLIGGYMAARAQTGGAEGGRMLSGLGALITGFLADKGGRAPNPARAGAEPLDAILDLDGAENPLGAIIASLGRTRQ